MYRTSKEACKILGIHPNTLRSWANSGKIKYYRTESGQRRYDTDDFFGNRQDTKQVVYCRVSSPKQKDDLHRQVGYMSERYPNAEIIKDIGSGINFKRKGLKAILERAMSGDKLQVVVAHRDRLSRFGFDLIEWIITRSGGELVVLEQDTLSPEEELTRDLLSILHVFSCRMHGLRNYKEQINSIISKPQTETNP